MKGLSPENDDYPDVPEESFTSFIHDESLKDIFQDRSLETQSGTLPDVNKQQTSTDNKQTKKLNKQVSWHDTQDAKNENTDSDDESSQEDENTEKLNIVCDKCSLEIKCCNCDSGVALDQCVEKDGKSEEMEDESNGKEKDVEPGKFDGVFSDTDDSEASAERYKIRGGGGGGGGYSPKIWVWVCGTLLETLTLFQTQAEILYLWVQMNCLCVANNL